MCGELRHLLADRRTYFGDPGTVFRNEDGARQWAIDKVEIVTLFLVGEEEGWGQFNEAAATLFGPPGAQRTNRGGVE
jgi:hypothetical protein